MKSFTRIFPAVLLVATVVTAGAAGSTDNLKLGRRGETVVLLQEWLIQTGFLRQGLATGYYGSQTTAAVRKYQSWQGLAVDGITGPITWCALARTILYGRKPMISSRDASEPLLDWATVDRLWPRGSIGWLTDLETRTTIRVKRYGGRWHADVEPLTEEDTRIFRQWYGQWSWTRRAVVFRAGRIVCAGSINGMPHGGEKVKNGFPGHFCLHFLGSRVHNNGRMDADHQRMVMRSAKFLTVGETGLSVGAARAELIDLPAGLEQ